VLDRGISRVDGRRRDVLPHPAVARSTPHDVLVQKVLERMLIDAARRTAF
jgi:hypothetical protein